MFDIYDVAVTMVCECNNIWVGVMLFVAGVTYGGVGGLHIDFVYTHMGIYMGLGNKVGGCMW